MASVYVRGFLKRTGERDLETLFSTFGAVNEVRMVRDFAFVIFKQRDQAKQAVSKMNGQSFQGQTLTVQIAKERPGPQPNDVCRSCGDKGHWQTNCPNDRRRRRRSPRRRSSSRSSDSDSSRSRDKRKKSKKQAVEEAFQKARVEQRFIRLFIILEVKITIFQFRFPGVVGGLLSHKKKR